MKVAERLLELVRSSWHLNITRFKGRDRGYGGDQFARIRGDWLVQDCFGRTGLNELAGAHHRDVGSDLRNDRKAVRNKDIREAQFPLQLLQQEQDLRADGNIQC